MIYFNKITNGFYISALNYIPENSVEISHEYHAELLKKQANGLTIQSDDNGYPIAAEYIMTKDEIKSLNKSKQQQLINLSNEKIVILQRIIKYNSATDVEKSQLEQLELFTIDVARIDLSDINVVFPEIPF